MWFTVVCTHIPIGTVDLPATELAAGRLLPLAGYHRIENRVRQGSAALLSFGFYGPAVSAIPDPARRRARLALWAAASLRLELADRLSGHLVRTNFVNLIEAATGGDVIVLARFRDSPAAVPAAVPTPPSAARGASGDSP